MIDTLIYAALTQPNVAAYLKKGAGPWRVYPARGLGHNGIPSDPNYPYVQYGDGGSNRVTAVRETRLTMVWVYDVWVYDKPGSFLRIKTIHNLLLQNLESIGGLTTPAGWKITESQFQTFGADAYDPVNQQYSKRASYRIVASSNPE